MGCAPSQYQRVINLKHPSQKDRSSTFPSTSTQFSTQERTFQTELRGSGEIGTLLISIAVPDSQTAKKDAKEIRERDESGFRKLITLPESSKEFSFKAATESFSSVDQKEMTFFRQTSRLRSNETSKRNSIAKTEQGYSPRRPSMFLLPGKSSDIQLKRFDTCGENLRATLSPKGKLSVDNFARSADELSPAIGSSSIREDSGLITTPSLSGSKLLVVVPEETRLNEGLGGEDSNKLILSGKSSPRQYSNKSLRHTRKASEGNKNVMSFWPTEKWTIERKESFNKSNESANFGKRDTEDPEAVLEDFLKDKEIEVGPAKEDKILEELTHQPEQAQKENMTGLKRNKRVVLPLIITVRTPTESDKEKMKSQTKDSNERVATKSTSKNRLDEVVGDMSLIKNRYKNQRRSSRLKSESGTPAPAISFQKEEALPTNLKTKFRANLLDLVAKRPSACHSVGTPQPNKKAEFGDYLDDISNLSMRSLQKSPPISNIRERDAGDNFFKFDSFDSDTGLISPIWSSNKQPGFPRDEGSSAMQKSVDNSRVSEDHSAEKKEEAAVEQEQEREQENESEEEEDMEDEEEEEYEFDIDNYTIVEEVKEVEIDETNGINIYRSKKTSKLNAHLAKLAQQHPHQSIKRSRFGARQSILAKSKSVNYDEFASASVPSTFKNAWQEREETNEKPAIVASSGENQDQREEKDNQLESNAKSQLSTQLRRRAFLPSRYSKSQVLEGEEKLSEEDRLKRINQYVVGDEIGIGYVGEVRFCTDSETQVQYSMKIIKKNEVSGMFAKGSEQLRQLQDEVALIKKIEHENVARLYEVIDDPINDKLYLIRESVQREGIAGYQAYYDQYSNGFLQEIREEVDSNTERSAGLKNSEEKIRKQFRELLLGVNYIHKHTNLVHGNIKPSNVLITKEGTVKLLDCSISCLVEDHETLLENVQCRVSFLPPEAWLSDSKRTEAFDVWGLGAMLYYWIYEMAPFSANNVYELKRKILKEEPRFSSEVEVNKKVIQLIKACLHKDPEQRPCLSEIMEHRWVTKYGQEPLDEEVSQEAKVSHEDVSQAITLRVQSWSLKPSRFVRSKGGEVIPEVQEEWKVRQSSLVIGEEGESP